MNKRVAVFCGASKGHNPVFQGYAHKLGEKLVENQLDLVYGGGAIGLMGVIADAVIKNKGHVIGVITRKLKNLEVGHKGLTQLHVVQTMHERKTLMAQLADGFIALPGGIGTLEEIIEVYTWLQLEDHQKPCAFLNVAGYYDLFFNFLDQMTVAGFLNLKTRNRLIIESDIDQLLVRMGIND